MIKYILIPLALLVSASLYAQPTVRNCKVYNNTASQHGGGIYLKTKALITEVWVQNNNANSVGGGIAVDVQANAHLENCLVTNNTARLKAGGVWLAADAGTLVSATVVNNSLLGPVGVSGVAVESGSNLVNTIVFGNRAVMGGTYATQLSCQGSSSYCALHGTFVSGVGNIQVGSADGEGYPVLAFVRPVETIGYSATDVSWKEADWTPASGTPVIDSGDNQSIVQVVDVMLHPRIVNKVVDIGAIEQSGSSGITSERQVRYVFVTPNPFADKIYLRNPTVASVDCFLYDLLGRCLMRQTLLPEAESTFSTEELPKGIYTVVALVNGNKSSVKLIKK